MTIGSVARSASTGVTVTDGIYNKGATLTINSGNINIVSGNDGINTNEDNVSVTCGAKVLGDVTMHANSLAAAGSVVVKDVPKNAIVGGVPAKVIAYKDESNLNFQG